MLNYFDFLRPLLFCLSEEFSHELALKALHYDILPPQPKPTDITLKSNIFGIDFISPIGLAAGFDKNAIAINGLAKQGFGFMETGTVTPIAQKGNDKPRLFRLTKDEAIINRMGFNNNGAQEYADNLRKYKMINADSSDTNNNINNSTRNTIIGANIGKNKDSPNDASDYINMMDKIYGLSHYITINISSPNTPNLRDIQNDHDLDIFLHDIMKHKNVLRKKHNQNIPIILKIAPDIDQKMRKNIADISLKYKIDGLIVSNTTINLRDKLSNDKNSTQTGGLSGSVLMDLSTEVLRDVYKFTQGKIPIIASGGVSSGADAYRKMRNGASLVQIYSAIIFNGFGIVPKIHNELSSLLKADGYNSVAQAIGADVEL